MPLRDPSRPPLPPNRVLQRHGGVCRFFKLDACGTSRHTLSGVWLPPWRVWAPVAPCHAVRVIPVWRLCATQHGVPVLAPGVPLWGHREQRGLVAPLRLLWCARASSPAGAHPGGDPPGPDPGGALVRYALPLSPKSLHQHRKNVPDIPCPHHLVVFLKTTLATARRRGPGWGG